MNVIERAKGIILNPKKEWETIAGEAGTIGQLYKDYVVILAAIGPVASIIGMALIGISLPLIGTYRVPISSAIGSAVVQYVLTLAGAYGLALIIDGLAPTFSGEKNLTQAFKVTIYSSTPAWIGGVFVLIPMLGVLGMLLGLYGLYVLYLGLPVLMKSPKEKSMLYTIAVIVAAVVIFLVVGAISHTFIPSPRLRP
jgi:hypothetical protein